MFLSMCVFVGAGAVAVNLSVYFSYINQFTRGTLEIPDYLIAAFGGCICELLFLVSLKWCLIVHI